MLYFKYFIFAILFLLSSVTESKTEKVEVYVPFEGLLKTAIQRTLKHKLEVYSQAENLNGMNAEYISYDGQIVLSYKEGLKVHFPLSIKLVDAIQLENGWYQITYEVLSLSESEKSDILNKKLKSFSSSQNFFELKKN